MNRLDSTTLVSGQIAPDDMPMIAALGVTMIVNNRPDGEEPGQPKAAEIEAAARAAGLAYRHIPIAGGFSAPQVAAMTDALEASEGEVLAFCKSGTRSTYVWALARSSRGAGADELIGQAAEAGYDLSPLRSLLRT